MKALIRNGGIVVAFDNYRDDILIKDELIDDQRNYVSVNFNFTS